LWVITEGFAMLYWLKTLFHKWCCWGKSRHRASALDFWKSNFFPLANRAYFESLAKKYGIKKWSWEKQANDEESAEETEIQESKGQGANLNLQIKPAEPKQQHKVVTDIVIGNKLGGGYFGDVYKGIWNKTTEVALKTVNDPNMNEEILREIDILEKLAHPNVVAYLGLFTGPTGQLFLVTEFMNRGSLDKMIVDNKNNITLLDLLAMAKQAAAGMLYLEGQGIVHRDLALRNLLVGTRGDKYERFVVKVADFGLSRATNHGYYKSDSKTIPIKWSALEILLYDSYTYTSKCDVWSFGVTLWELFSYGVTPYPGMSNQECVAFLRNGERLERPEKCPNEIYSLMLDCWKEKPEERPNFEQIFETINGLFAVMLPPEDSDEEEDEGAEKQGATLWMPPPAVYNGRTQSSYPLYFSKE